MFVRPANLPQRFHTVEPGSRLSAPAVNRIGGGGGVSGGRLPHQFVIEAGLYQHGGSTVRVSPEDLWGVLGDWTSRRPNDPAVPVIGEADGRWLDLGKVVALRPADRSKTSLLGEVAWDDAGLADYVFKGAASAIFTPNFGWRHHSAKILTPWKLVSVTAEPNGSRTPQFVPIENRATAPGISAGPLHVLSVGRFRSTRTGETLTVNRQLLASLAGFANLEKAGILVDFDHASRHQGKSSVAAGWANNFRVDGDRLVADVTWTDLGRPIANRASLPGITQEHERVVAGFRAGEPAFVEPGLATARLGDGQDSAPIQITHLALTQTQTLFPA